MFPLQCGWSLEKEHPKYLVEKNKENEGKFDLLGLETCLVEHDKFAWILDSGATNHVCSSL